MHKGFTLIEMIVVIAIIAILGTIVAPNAYKMIEKAKVAKAASNFNTIGSAASAYFADTGVYPPNDEGPCPAGVSCRGIDFFENNASVVGWNGPYLQQWPKPGWVSPEGNHADFQWQGNWIWNTSDPSDQVTHQTAEINFVTTDIAFAQSRGQKIDQILDDGNLS